MKSKTFVKRVSPLKSSEVTQLAARLRLKLGELTSDSAVRDQLDRLPTDLTDVYVICLNYVSLVGEFLNVDRLDREEILKILFEIEQHLYDHLDYHHKSLKKGINKLSTIVEPNHSKREKFYLNYLRGLVGAPAKSKANHRSSPRAASKRKAAKRASD